MRIAISSQGKVIESQVDPRFGRAKYFIIYDSETNQSSLYNNSQNLNLAQGAGIQTARNVVDMKVDGVISGNMGPKAFATLNTANIKIYTGANGTVSNAVEDFKAGKLTQVENANVQGHWM